MVITTVTGGGGRGVGVGLGVGDGVGRGGGVGVGRGKGVGDGVGRGADVGEGVGCAVAVAVAVGLAPPVVGDADTGVLAVLLVGLLALPTIAVGVDPVPAAGEPPPQAATTISMPNNTKLNQIPGCNTCFRLIIFSSRKSPREWMDEVKDRACYRNIQVGVTVQMKQVQ